MFVNIRDVARRLDLSITTVSRALDGYEDVAEETRQRVVLVAREMGYEPSRAARQLRRRRAETIGFIIPTTTPRFSDPFFSEFLAGLGDEVAQRRYELLISAAPPGADNERELYQRWVQSRRIDGVVLTRMRTYDWRVEYLAQRAVPFIALGRTTMSIAHPHIEVDSRTGFARVVAALVERGHRRIGFIGASPGLVLQADRMGGYRDGLASAGIPFDPSLVAEGNLTRLGGYRAAPGLLDLPNPPTAVLGVNDLTAIGVMRAAHERGLVVGRDLAVTGYDGIEESEHTTPPLATLNVPVYDVARRLVRMLLALVDGEPLPEPQVLLQPELILRQSIGS